METVEELKREVDRLRDLLFQISNLSTGAGKWQQAEVEPGVLGKAVSSLDFDTRLKNVLSLMGIETVGQLARKTESELLLIGDCSLRRIKSELENLGLRLGIA